MRRCTTSDHRCAVAAWRPRRWLPWSELVATDYSGAVETAQFLPNSRLLSFAGTGHTALGRNGGVTRHIVAYLQSGVLPPDGTVCSANPSPLVAPEDEASIDDAMSAARAANLPWLAALRTRQSSRHVLR
jgi:hypothetical protein